MLATIEAIIRQYDFNLLYAKALVQDLDEEQMTVVPGPGLLNHPAFTLGHLVTGSALMAEDLGAPFEIPEGWGELFLRKGPDDQTRPEPDAARYPAKQVLLDELEHQHQKVRSLLWQIHENKYYEDVKWRFGQYMPTLLDLAIFMCISHEHMHLGQLAAWRRAMNLPSALKTL